jgi:hypothetical protein
MKLLTVKEVYEIIRIKEKTLYDGLIGVQSLLLNSTDFFLRLDLEEIKDPFYPLLNLIFHLGG